MSVRNRQKKPKDSAKTRLKDYAERVAEGERVASGVAPLARRNVLLSGANRSSPNLHILASALRYVPKGREIFIGSILRAARNGDTDAHAWMKTFESLLPSEQKVVDFDDICEACGVAPDRIMAIAVSTQMKVGNDIAEFTAAVFHPKVVHQTAKSAMRIGGDFAQIAQKDREMMLQHGKFIAGPKGINVNMHATAVAQAAAAAAQSEPSVPTFSESVLGAQRTQIAIQRVIAADDTP